MTFEGFDAASEGLREALCALGNGRFVTRGAACESRADDVHYPGCYLAGGYDRLTTVVEGRDIENEDLVNWPNWLPLQIRLGDGPWMTADAATVLDYRQTLDMRGGMLTREMRLCDSANRTTRLVERRLVSMANARLAAIELTVTPENWSGPLTIRSFIDGSVTNRGVPRYRQLNGAHVAIDGCDFPDAATAQLRCRSVQSGIEVAFAARTQVFDGEAPAGVDGSRLTAHGKVGLDFALAAGEGRPVRIEKVAAFVTSRDRAIASPETAAFEETSQSGRFATLEEEHRRAWEMLWDDFDIEVEDGSETEQVRLRLHLFHLLQTLSPHTIEMDAGAPARGWHGEAYRGHIFWDEMFIFRVLNLRSPHLTRALLRYRWRRLRAARSLAEEAGLRGAMYPWQSGSDGREETQKLHLNPVSGRWLPDVTRRQRHIGLALAYSIWNYYRATSDTHFLIENGTEMLLEIARFFAALADWDEASGRYHIRGVMGPDEFHTAYPDADPAAEGGIDDNAYTNVLCAWVMTRAIDALEQLPSERRQRLYDALLLDEAELALWQDIATRLHVPFLSNGLIAQFEGYEKLEEFDWEGYGARYGDIRRLDRILEAEGRNVNAYKVSKQADVLMLPFLFSSEELGQIFEQLGYVFDPADIPRLAAYYDARTSHGSTLSAVVHAWVLSRSDRTHSWSLFGEALGADVKDVQGGTTREGIHLGAMCGTIDIVQSGYAGIEVREGVLHVDPVLPDGLKRIRTRVRYLGQDVALEATQATLQVQAGNGSSNPIVISYRGRLRQLAPGASATFRLVQPRERRERGMQPPERG